MLTLTQAKTVALNVEVQGGAHTANAGLAGWWRRIALALEAAAAAATTANTTIRGWMERSARAAETLGGTNGTAENRTYEGVLKRIVDGLEAANGEVNTGTLVNRLIAASATYAESPDFPQVTNGGFASGANWTLTQGGGAGSVAITGGQLVFTSGSLGTGIYAEQALADLSAFEGETVRVTYDYVSGTRAAGFSMGGGAVVNTVANTVQLGATLDVVVGNANENLRIQAVSALSGGPVIDNVSIALL